MCKHKSYLTESSPKSKVCLLPFPLALPNKSPQNHYPLLTLDPETTPTQCAIFSYPAKFRDPVTGLPYCNTYAYKEIQKLRRSEYKWSGLLGAYVGQGTYAARGVPARFMGGAVKAGGLATSGQTGGAQ